jgi:hypothetical protein
MVNMEPRKRIDVILEKIVPQIVASVVFDADEKAAMLKDQRSRAERLSEECDVSEKEPLQSKIKDAFATLGEYLQENPSFMMQYPLGLEEFL